MKERKPHGLLVGGLLATLLLFGTNTAVFADAGAGAAVPAAQAPSGRTQVAVARRSYPDVAPATVEQTSPGHYRLDWSGLEGGVTITVASAADAPAAARRLLARGLEGESASVVVDREARPYFHIEDRHGRGWWAAERLLPLEGGRNFRDLGGYLTADGRQVRWGKIFRAGAMADLTAVDQQYLAELGLRQVCDLRTTIEREQEPVKWLEAGGEVDYWTRDYVMSSADFNRVLAGGDITETEVRDSFARLYASLPYEQEVAYRDMFRMLVEGDVPLAFNCTAGKDRTGVAAALILSALGVPRETVFADYGLSNRYLTADRFLQAKKPESDDEAQARTPMQQAMVRLPAVVIQAMLGAEPDYLAATFDAIEKRNGSVENYLREVLGVTDADLATLRQSLLD